MASLAYQMSLTVARTAGELLSLVIVAHHLFPFFNLLFHLLLVVYYNCLLRFGEWRFSEVLAVSMSWPIDHPACMAVCWLCWLIWVWRLPIQGAAMKSFGTISLQHLFVCLSLVSHVIIGNLWKSAPAVAYSGFQKGSQSHFRPIPFTSRPA